MSAFRAVSTSVLAVLGLCALMVILAPNSDSPSSAEASPKTSLESVPDTSLSSANNLNGRAFTSTYTEGDLAGSTLGLVFTPDGHTIKIRNKQTGVSQTSPAAIFNVSPTIKYFGWLTKEGYHTSAVYDFDNMHVTVSGSNMHPGVLDTTRGTFSSATGPSQLAAPLGPLVLSENPLLGMKFENTFTEGGMGGNTYTFEIGQDTLTYLCIKGPNKGVGETCQAQTSKITEGIFMSGWTENLKPEGDGPFHAAIVYDFNTGRLYNSGSDGTDLYTSTGKFVKLAK